MGHIDEPLLGKIRDDKRTRVIGGASDADIDAAQKAVGVRFPPSYTKFLRLFNGGEFRSFRLHRIGEDAMVEAMEDEELLAYRFVGDLVNYVISTDDTIATWQGTEEEKETSRHTNPFFEGIQARRYFPFGDDYGGNLYCFDLTQRSDEGEYPVLQWNVVAWSDLPEWRTSNFPDFLSAACDYEND